jgi:hypothetical protein
VGLPINPSAAALGILPVPINLVTFSPTQSVGYNVSKTFLFEK